MLLYFVKLCSRSFVLICCFFVYSHEENHGREANNDEFPYMVSLQFTDRTPFCDGGLLSVQHVLTACHCVGFYLGPTFSSYLPQMIIAVAGSVDASPHGNGTIRNVYSVRHHLKCEKRHFGWAFDIGLITLTSPFEITGSINVLPMYSFDSKILKKQILLSEKHEICQTITWGSQSITKGDPYDKNLLLNVIEAELIPWKKCQEMLCKLPNKRCPTDLKERSQICAIATKGEICSGDSGALVCSGYYYGLTSWGPICGEKKYPTVYQALHDGLNWPEEKFMVIKSSTFCCKNCSMRHLLIIAAILHYYLIC